MSELQLSFGRLRRIQKRWTELMGRLSQWREALDGLRYIQKPWAWQPPHISKTSSDEERSSSTSTSLIYLHTAEPTLINLFSHSEKIIEKDICSISLRDFGKQKIAVPQQHALRSWRSEGLEALRDRVGSPRRHTHNNNFGVRTSLKGLEQYLLY